MPAFGGTYLLCGLVLLKDIIVVEAETVSVPELGVGDFLVLGANLIKQGRHECGQLSLHEVCRLQLVRPLHFGDGELEGLLELRHGRDALYDIYDSLCVLNSLLSDRIIPWQELVARDGGTHVDPHSLVLLTRQDALHSGGHAVKDVDLY